jgi:hypothetical protein
VVKQELLKSTKAILSVPVLLGLKMRTVRLVFCDKNYFGHNCPKDTVKQIFATLVSYRVGSTEATIKISSSKNFNEKADYIVEYKVRSLVESVRTKE